MVSSDKEYFEMNRVGWDQRVNEFPFSPYNCSEGLVEREPGRFYLNHNGNDVPITYSITGRKVA